MSEYIYGLRQRTGRKPVIKKLGAVRAGIEQTPVVFNGRPIMVESRLGGTDGADVQHIRVIDLETNEVYAILGNDHYFASAYAENGTLYIFCTDMHDSEAMTMFDTDKGEEAWHDNRGGHNVCMYKTRDFKSFEYKEIINCPQKRFWNTSVCKGEDGYVMAIEVSAEDGFPNEKIGVHFTEFFAKSADLENWEMLPDEYSYTPVRYNACPALRYFYEYYYMICLEELPALRYAPYVYRTKDFLHFEVGFHNPVMMYGDDDRVICPDCEKNFDERERDLLYNGLNINCSDVDLFEYGGKTVIYYANGDQMSYAFLCKAEYDGKMQDLLEGFFK